MLPGRPRRGAGGRLHQVLALVRRRCRGAGEGTGSGRGRWGWRPAAPRGPRRPRGAYRVYRPPTPGRWPTGSPTTCSGTTPASRASSAPASPPFARSGRLRPRALRRRRQGRGDAPARDRHRAPAVLAAGRRGDALHQLPVRQARDLGAPRPRRHATPGVSLGDWRAAPSTRPTGAASPSPRRGRQLGRLRGRRRRHRDPAAHHRPGHSTLSPTWSPDGTADRLRLRPLGQPAALRHERRRVRAAAPHLPGQLQPDPAVEPARRPHRLHGP